MVEFTERLMHDRGFHLRTDLQKADNGLYLILTKRGLLGKIGFLRTKRYWVKMTDDEIVSVAERLLREGEIRTRSDLKGTDSGLHEALRIRGLLDGIFLQLESSQEKDQVRQVLNAMREF